MKTVTTYREVSDPLVAAICKVHPDQIKRTHRAVAQAKWEEYLKANERETYWELNVETKEGSSFGAGAISKAVGKIPSGGGVYLDGTGRIDAYYAYATERWARKAADRVRRAFGSKVSITVQLQTEE